MDRYRSFEKGEGSMVLMSVVQKVHDGWYRSFVGTGWIGSNDPMFMSYKILIGWRVFVSYGVGG